MPAFWSELDAHPGQELVGRAAEDMRDGPGRDPEEVPGGDADAGSEVLELGRVVGRPGRVARKQEEERPAGLADL